MKLPKSLVSTGQKFHYQIDKLVSRGMPTIIGLLLFLAFLCLPLVSWIYVSITGSDESIYKVMWLSLVHSLDPGTLSGNEFEESKVLLSYLLAITFGGILVLSTLIGLITTGIREGIDTLRKGRSKVFEKDHTVILGWEPQTIMTVLHEITVSNKAEGPSSVVVMADEDKVMMQDAIASAVTPHKNTRVIVRTGNPINPSDLEIPNLHESRSIIILPPDEAFTDVNVIKTVLSILHNESGHGPPKKICAAIRYKENADLIDLIDGAEVQCVRVNEIIARLIAQTFRQSGVNIVYEELLRFEGDELYLHYEKDLVGKTYYDSLFAFESSTVIGVYSKSGGHEINPPMDRVFGQDDGVIVIASDSKSTVLRADRNIVVDKGQISLDPKTTMGAMSVLILNWNRFTPKMLPEMDHYLGEGSKVTVLTPCKGREEQLKKSIPPLTNITDVNVVDGAPTNQVDIEKLGLDNFDVIIILSDLFVDTPHMSDAKTFLSLLNIKAISKKKGKKYRVLAQLIDPRNQKIAPPTDVDDVIISHGVISSYLTQVSRNLYINDILMDMFGAHGSEIYFKPVVNYLNVDSPVTFETMKEAGSQIGETVIGYQSKELTEKFGEKGGIIINPQPNKPIQLGKQDSLIVYALEG